MPYRIKRPAHLADEIRRIAEEQIDRAIGDIDDGKLDRPEAVHQVRKRCKKVRALLRLLRGPLDETDLFDRENAWFRDAARELSHVRDAEVLIETYDTLMDHFREQVERRTFASIRRHLTLRRKAIAAHEEELDERLAAFRDKMAEGRERISEWAQHAEGFESLLPGLAKTYRRGRKAMTAADDDPKPELFHEWRKRTKYHWYHCRLLGDLWRPVMNARRKELSRLGDLLGDAHDLSVFHATLSREAKDFGEDETLEAIRGLIEGRRAELRQEARSLGALVFSEKTKHLTRRFRNYWDAWCDGEAE